MASNESGEDLSAGRWNRGQNPTLVLADRLPNEDFSYSWGNFIFGVEVAPNARDPDDYDPGDGSVRLPHTPSKPLTAIRAIGWTTNSGTGPLEGMGVEGIGGVGQGTGVLGRGGGRRVGGFTNGNGGIGVHGLGGNSRDDFPQLSAPDAGAGVVGEGGVKRNNSGILQVAAGVIGAAGDTDLPRSPLTEAAGVVGVSKHGPGGVFASESTSQVHLEAKPIPQPFAETPFPQVTHVVLESTKVLPTEGRPGDLLTLIDPNGVCTLWFCVRAPNGRLRAVWRQVLLGNEHMAT